MPNKWANSFFLQWDFFFGMEEVIIFHSVFSLDQKRAAKALIFKIRLRLHKVFFFLLIHSEFDNAKNIFYFQSRNVTLHRVYRLTLLKSVWRGLFVVAIYAFFSFKLFQSTLRVFLLRHARYTLDLKRRPFRFFGILYVPGVPGIWTSLTWQCWFGLRL